MTGLPFEVSADAAWAGFKGQIVLLVLRNCANVSLRSNQKTEEQRAILRPVLFSIVATVPLFGWLHTHSDIGRTTVGEQSSRMKTKTTFYTLLFDATWIVRTSYDRCRGVCSQPFYVCAVHSVTRGSRNSVASAFCKPPLCFVSG
jgi:hypothetical protein